MAGGSLVVPFLLYAFLSMASSAVVTLEEKLPSMAFEEGYTQLFGDGNLMLLRDGKTVHIALDERTGKTSKPSSVYPLLHLLPLLLFASYF